VLEEVHAYNLRIRKVRDWKEIAGATVGGRIYKKSKRSAVGIQPSPRPNDGSP